MKKTNPPRQEDTDYGVSIDTPLRRRLGLVFYQDEVFIGKAMAEMVEMAYPVWEYLGPPARAPALVSAADR